MADAAAARREARRRRILENSQNRLQIISGKLSDESLKESPTELLHSDENCEFFAASSSSTFCPSPLVSPSNNGVLVNESDDSYELLSTQHDVVAAGDTEVVNDLAAFGSPAPEPVPIKSLWEKIFAYKYDVAILALIIQVFYVLFTFETAYFFLPLVMYSVTKLMWYPAESTTNSIANVVLLLNGMSATRVQKIMNIMHYIGAISQDVCIYLFTTICIQSILMMLVKNLLT